jgi:NagD protein
MADNMAKLHAMKAFICDMDGVIYHGNKLLPGVLQFIEWLKSEKKQFLFLTNNSHRTPREQREKLLRLGADVGEEHFYTSALATAEFLSRQCPNGSAFVIGGPGLINALYDAGFSMNSANPDYVVVGFALDYNYRTLEHASHLVSRGAKLIGTDANPTFITKKGLSPGTGALIAPIEIATCTKAYYVGKPNPLMTHLALTKLGSTPQETAIIGDRIDTDIIAGIEADITTVLVLSGITKREELKHWGYRADYVLEGVHDIVASLEQGGESLLAREHTYGDGEELTIFERAMILKRVRFFSEIAEEVLAQVASALEEMEIEAGTTIITRGQPNGFLYVIVDGGVRVHSEQQEITRFGKHEVFGEIGILDSASAASASVTTLNNTRLLRFDQQTFLKLLHDHTEIAKNTLRVLADRLRSTNMIIDDLGSRIQ